MNKTFLVTLVISCAIPAHAELVFDRGLSTGSPGGLFANNSASQNFAHSFVLANDATVARYRLYSAGILNVGDELVVRLYSDSAGDPGSLLSSQTVSILEKTSLGNVANLGVIYSFDVNLTTPWSLTGGTTYWAGAAGNGMEAGQMSLLGAENSTMARFDGATFQGQTPTNWGDQAFQLYSDPVPEPMTLSILGIGALAALRKRKKA